MATIWRYGEVFLAAAVGDLAAVCFGGDFVYFVATGGVGDLLTGLRVGGLALAVGLVLGLALVFGLAFAVGLALVPDA